LHPFKAHVVKNSVTQIIKISFGEFVPSRCAWQPTDSL